MKVRRDSAAMVSSSLRYECCRLLTSGVVLQAVFVLLALSVIHGCASTGAPSQQELRDISTGISTIVLIRVEAAIAGEPYAPFSSGLVDDNICFGLGSLETGGRMQRIEQQRFLSPESRLAGWVYMVLPPETHYLTVHPPRRTDSFSYMRRFERPPRWRMDIPEGAKVIYVGTLHVNGVGDRLVFGGAMMREITGVSIDGLDHESAIALSEMYFPDLGAPELSLLQPYEGGPLRFHTPMQPAR